MFVFTIISLGIKHILNQVPNVTSMIIHPIIGVLKGCRHRKDTELKVNKFISVQNREEQLVLVGQYKRNKNLDCCFRSKT